MRYLVSLLYIDIGSGSYFLQIIAGAFVAVGAAFITYWRAFRERVSGLFRRRDDSADVE